MNYAVRVEWFDGSEYTEWFADYDEAVGYRDKHGKMASATLYECTEIVG